MTQEAINFAKSVYERCAESQRTSEAAFQQRMTEGVQPQITLVWTEPTTLFLLNAAYLLITWALYHWMQGHKGDFKVALKPVIFVYNVSCVWAAAYVVWGIGMHKWQHRDEPFVCNDGARRSADGDKLAFVFWVFYAQKFWEFCDTWFFILRRSFRQVTFLHVFHHSSITLVVGSILKYDYSGDMYLPIVLNAFVHVLMYSHYLVTALGIKSWWRKYLTTLQLSQFCLIATQSVLAWRAGPACGAPDFAKVILVAYMLSMLILFGRFFLRRYVFKKQDTQFCGVIKEADAMQAPKTLNGIAQLDSSGSTQISVQVPHPSTTSAAAGTQYAYQLTAMGAPMPQLHVTKELAWSTPHAHQGSFAIGGGKPGATVCWQLIRLHIAQVAAPDMPKAKAQ